MQNITPDTSIKDLSELSLEELKAMEAQAGALMRMYRTRINFIQVAKGVAFARESIQRAQAKALELVV